MNFKQWLAFLILVIIVLIAALLYYASMVKKQGAARKDLVKAAETFSKTIGDYPWSDIPTGFNDSGSVNLSTRKIAERHKRVFMSDLPHYVENLKGAAGYERETMIKANWMFKVPKEHLTDFNLYLKSLGVVEGAMHQDYQASLVDSDDAIMGTPHSQRNPPIPQKLLFTGSMVLKRGLKLKGMHFLQGKDITYYFFNTYINTSMINIMYSHESGNCFIMEQHMDP